MGRIGRGRGMSSGAGCWGGLLEQVNEANESGKLVDESVRSVDEVSWWDELIS